MNNFSIVYQLYRQAYKLSLKVGREWQSSLLQIGLRNEIRKNKNCFDYSKLQKMHVELVNHVDILRKATSEKCPKCMAKMASIILDQIRVKTCYWDLNKNEYDRKEVQLKTINRLVSTHRSSMIPNDYIRLISHEGGELNEWDMAILKSSNIRVKLLPYESYYSEEAYKDIKDDDLLGCKTSNIK